MGPVTGAIALKINGYTAHVQAEQLLVLADLGRLVSPRKERPSDTEVRNLELDSYKNPPQETTLSLLKQQHPHDYLMGLARAA